MTTLTSGEGQTALANAQERLAAAMVELLLLAIDEAKPEALAAPELRARVPEVWVLKCAQANMTKILGESSSPVVARAAAIVESALRLR